MKRIVVAVIIPIISVALGIFSFLYIKSTCNQTVAELDEILLNIETEDAERVNLLTVQTNRNWNKKIFLLNILIGRISTEEIDKQLNKIIFFAQIGDYESVLLYTADCREELLYITESNEPKISAVF